MPWGNTEATVANGVFPDEVQLIFEFTGGKT